MKQNRMSTSSAFVTVKKASLVGEFYGKAKKLLAELEIIDGYYDKDEEWFAPGNKLLFRYAIIYDNEWSKLVPGFAPDGFGATCAYCQADVDEQLYDVIDDYYDFEAETGKGKDMHTLGLTCHHCKKKTSLGQLVFTKPAVLTKQFLQFVDLLNEMPTELIKTLEQKLGTELQVIYERN